MSKGQTMLIDIDKIVVGDRIRRDFGDLDELAEDIKENGLINPPVVNKNYELLAGERRLRACKKLGWKQVEVRIMDTRNEAHDLNIEMSENIVRRNFTNSELAEGIRRQMAIECERAKKRQCTHADVSISQGGTARDEAGAAFGISGKQAEKVVFVDDHRDLLDPADFVEWDEGKLSTNKAFQRIKTAQKEALSTAKVGWSTKAVRALLENPKDTSREPCFICHKHETITELHHVIQVSELTELLNKGVIKIEDVKTPIVWLCPNCHAYVHAAMRGDVDAVLPRYMDSSWRERYEIIASNRAMFAKHLSDESK